ncbi:APC family permease [Pyrobaculum sp.]|uniref:APC family permease n=1 Tax=Pyrobaculum sp. TaxID=2004705 RepID=UPI0031692C6B
MAVHRDWLRRRLGVFEMFALIYSDIQSTFYFVLGFLLLSGGQYGFFAVAYSIALMAAIALSYGEMGSRFPEAGGSYLYVKYSFGKTIAYLSVWLLAFDQIIMISYGTIDAAKVLHKIWGVGTSEAVVAAAISTALFALSLIGIRESANFAKAVAVFDVVIMATVIVVALATYPAAPPSFNWDGVVAANLFFAFSLASRGYTGVDAIGQLAGEAREPLVQVPRATLLVIGMGVFIGLGLTAAAMSALAPGDLQDPALAPVYLAQKVNHALQYLVSASIVLVMTVAALAGYTSFTRLTYILSDEGLMPSFFKKLHKKFRTPHSSLALAYLVSLLFIAPGEVDLILSIYAVGSLTNYMLVALALAKAARSGTLYGAFKTPLIRGIPLSALLAIVMVTVGLALTILEKYPYLWIIGVWAAAGALFYAAVAHRSGKTGNRGTSTTTNSR